MDAGSKQFLNLLTSLRNLDYLATPWERLADDLKDELSLLGIYTDHGTAYDTYLWLQTLQQENILNDTFEKIEGLFQDFQNLSATLPQPQLLDEYLNFQEQRQVVKTNAKESVYDLVKRVQKSYEYTRLAYARQSALLAQEAITKKDSRDTTQIASEKINQTERELVQAVSPKSQTYERLVSKVDTLSQTVIENTSPTLDPKLKAIATSTLTKFIISGTLDPQNPNDLATAAEIVSARLDPSISSPANDYLVALENQESKQNLPHTNAIKQIAGQTILQSPPPTPSDNLITHLTQVSNALNQNLSRFPDLLDPVTPQVIAFQKGYLTNHQQDYQPQNSIHLRNGQIEAVTKELVNTFPSLFRAFPNRSASGVAKTLTADPTHPKYSPQVVSLVGQFGKDPQGTLIMMARVYASRGNRPETFAAIQNQTHTIQNSALFNDTFQELKGAGSFYYGLTNRLTSFLPSTTSKYVNYVLHPIDSVKSWIGNTAAGQAVKQVGQAMVAKLGQSSFARLATVILGEGVKKGVAKVLAQTIVSGAAQIGIDLGVAAAGGPPGWLIALIMLAIQLAFLFAASLLSFIKKKSKEMMQDAASAAYLLSQMLGVWLPAAGNSLIGLSFSAVFAIFIGATFTFIIYTVGFVIGPIISGVAYLETGIRDSSRFGFLNEGRPALLPPGALPDSCPQGIPQRGYGITQGSNVGTHTSGWRIVIAGNTFTAEGEAIDYGTPVNTPVYATHDGEAYYFQSGDNQPFGYGNYVAILGLCKNPQSGQEIKFLTTYAHLNAANIKRGGPTSVKRGDLVGLSDNTGTSSGPHLHYEIFGLGDIYRYVGR